MDEFIQVDDQWYIAANSRRASAGSQVLKAENLFVVFDRLGEVGVSGSSEQGLYRLGTRHLSRWELFINGGRPMLLDSTVKEDNRSMVVQMTMPELTMSDGTVVPQGTLHVFRTLFLHESVFYEHLSLTNYARGPLEVNIEYRFASDYKDIFEVRGADRDERGKTLDAKVADRSVLLGYTGLDGCVRKSRLEFDGEVVGIDNDRCAMRLRLGPTDKKVARVAVSCFDDHQSVRSQPHAEAKLALETPLGGTDGVDVFTSNEQFNSWINRSVADLRMLVTDTTFGRYPYAGVPWFATPFGRDGIITGLETCWVQPELTKGVLSFLAATQASESDPATEAEPGKILHEMRDGEMAALGEIPFRKYYGTVDATPLFVVLAGKYARRTGDIAFIEFIWKNIQRAIHWIDEYGDMDNDGFVEYASHHERGLLHQCWKDSDDSIFHADGSDVNPPIAASEVQGYVYEAKLMAAEMADTLNENDWAKELRAQASGLKKHFNESYWISSIDTFALALDGDKRPCAVRSSNTGHLLYSGIVDESLARRVADTLTNQRSFNGWGIRTISEGESRYNPMSYHNGSIWPHDTAIGAVGLARFGFREEASQVASGLFAASIFNDLHRLPELFCGFDRLSGHGPTLYPVACSPQAWAAGAVFLILQAMLGLTFSPNRPQVRFDNPRLPDFLDWVRIRNLRIGNGVVDIVVHRHPRDVGVNVERKVGNIQIAVLA